MTFGTGPRELPGRRLPQKQGPQPAGGARPHLAPVSAGCRRPWPHDGAPTALLTLPEAGRPRSQCPRPGLSWAAPLGLQTATFPVSSRGLALCSDILVSRPFLRRTLVLLDYGPTLWPRLTFITSLKAPSANKSHWGGGGGSGLPPVHLGGHNTLLMTQSKPSWGRRCPSGTRAAACSLPSRNSRKADFLASPSARLGTGSCPNVRKAVKTGSSHERPLQQTRGRAPPPGLSHALFLRAV